MLALSQPRSQTNQSNSSPSHNAPSLSKSAVQSCNDRQRDAPRSYPGVPWYCLNNTMSRTGAPDQSFAYSKSSESIMASGKLPVRAVASPPSKTRRRFTETHPQDQRGLACPPQLFLPDRRVLTQQRAILLYLTYTYSGYRFNSPYFAWQQQMAQRTSTSTTAQVTYISYCDPVVILCMALLAAGSGMLTTLDGVQPGAGVVCGLRTRSWSGNTLHHAFLLPCPAPRDPTAHHQETKAN